MVSFLSKILGDGHYYDVENKYIESANSNSATYRLGEVNIEYIRGVAELVDYEWFIKIILDKVKSDTLVFVDLKSIKNEEEKFKIKSQIRARVGYINGTVRDLRRDQDLCLVASGDISALIEDMGFEELSKDKKIKVIKNLKLEEDNGAMLVNVLDAYSKGSTLIIDLSSEERESVRRDKFHCLWGACMVVKGSFRCVDNHQHVFVFAPDNAITTFDNFG